MDGRSAWKWIAALACAAFVPVGGGLAYRGAPPGEVFLENFVDLNRGMDDDATAVAYDPRSKILAIGRDSGRLEIWDTRRIDSRMSREAHTVRIDHVAIGSEDGIVLTTSAGTTAMGLDPKGMPKVWDARSGELLASLPGEWHGGPVSAAPVKGYYLIASADELRLYDHARRAVVGEAVDFDGSVTALGSDRASGLIAAGSSSGELRLLRLDTAGVVPRLRVVRSTTTHGLESRTDVLATMLRDEGRRLVTVHWLPSRTRRETPPSVTGKQAEIVEWNTQTWRRERTFPLTLEAVHRASYTPGEPWLVLAGNLSRRGKIELIDLQGGEAWRYKANTTHPVAVLLPPMRAGLILQHGGATRIRYLDPH